MGGDETLNIIIKLRDEASRQLESMASTVSNFKSKIKPAADASRQFAIALGVAGTAAGGFAVTALKSAANLEQTRIAFETMLGSAEKADDFIKQMVLFAKTTPFELKGLEDASKRLLAYGIQQEDVIPNLKMLGDIAAGVGMDKLPNLILAFGQVRAASKLTGMELRQFTEAGVPLLEELSKVTGMAVEDMAGNIADLNIPFSTVQKALANLTSEGGRFNNLMEKQAKSLGGMWSNLADAWEQFLRGEGAKLIDWAKTFVLAITDLVQNTLPKWISVLDKLGKFLKEHQSILWLVAGAIIGGLVPAVISAAIAFAAWAFALGPFIIAGAAIAVVVGKIVKIIDLLRTDGELVIAGLKAYWQDFKDKISEVASGIETRISDMWGSLKEKFITSGEEMKVNWNENWASMSESLSTTWSTIQTKVQSALEWLGTKMLEYSEPISRAWNSLWSSLSNGVATAWEVVKNTIKSSINWIIEKINTVINAMNSIAQKGFGIFGGTAPQISNIPLLANGGIVNRPTLAMIGEAGPEAVIPLNRGGISGVGSGINITINYPEFRSAEDETRLKRMLDDYFRPILINNKIA